MSSVTGMNFVVCSYGEFQPGYRDEIQGSKPMAPHKQVSFTTITASSALVTLLMRLIRVLFEVEMHTR